MWNIQMVRVILLGYRHTFLSIKNLKIVYEDENLIVIDKDFDLRINTDKPWCDILSLQMQLLYHRIDKTVKGAFHSFCFCHQLDYATSGCICIAYDRSTARNIGKAFEKRNVGKQYLALVWGHMEQTKTFDINEAIGISCAFPNSGRSKYQVVASDTSCINPREAVTRVIPLALGYFQNFPVTKVLLLPRTGRQHQLRVHLKSIGHHIVGDIMYGNKDDTKADRMMLHAYRLFIKTNKHTIDCITYDPFMPHNSPWTVSSVLVQKEDFLNTFQNL